MPDAVATDFDPYDIADPFGLYARARAEAPVFFSEATGYWVVSRYDDILAIFKDPATFSSENTQQPFKERPPEVQRVFDEAGKAHGSGLSGIQPPDHTRLRGFISKAFTPRRVAAMEPDVRAMTLGMIERFERRGSADLVADLAFELPALVIFHLLGVPEHDVPLVKEWARSRVALNFADTPAGEQVGHAENMVAYWRYCVALVESRFDSPTDDLTGELARIYQEGDRSATIDEIAGLIHTQLFAGHETTSALLGGGLLELLRDRERWDELCTEPALIPTAVEEMLRLVTPVFAWKRRLKTPARVGDVDLPEGANILMLLGSANRDAATFCEGERMDLHRDNARQHLAFGHGIHFCLGASLARLEATVVLEELTRRLPTMRLVEGQKIEFPANSTFRGPLRVLVEWEDASPRPVSGPAHVQALSDCEDVSLVGGKALSLGTMLRAGLPVPPGFAVTTTAYETMLSEGGLAGLIAAELAALDVHDVHALDQVAEGLRGQVVEAALPAGLDDAIAAAYQVLCDAEGGSDVPVAVRSSATAEDSADDSFAGQQDTYLWVSGADAVVSHVKRCWASLFSARSIAYRRERGIADAGVLMAVVVQRMVPAASAGVAMTLDPANGDRCIIAIESSFGLGETVVGGTVTPDTFRVDKVMLEIVKTVIAEKGVELVPDPAGGVSEREIEEERRRQPSLTDAQVKAVATLAKQAEQHYGCPQDVEWALDPAGAVVLLQSRPETVWSHLKQPAAAGVGLGMAGIVDTLINPLAGKRSPDDGRSQ